MASIEPDDRGKQGRGAVPAGHYRSELRVILPGETLADALAPFATLAPERVRAGGNRPRCKDHSYADVIVKRIAVCEECGQVVAESASRVSDDEPPDYQNGSPGNASAAASTDDTLGDQNGSLTAGGLDAQNGSPAMPRNPNEAARLDFETEPESQDHGSAPCASPACPRTVPAHRPGLCLDCRSRAPRESKPPPEPEPAPLWATGGDS